MWELVPWLEGKSTGKLLRLAGLRECPHLHESWQKVLLSGLLVCDRIGEPVSHTDRLDSFSGISSARHGLASMAYSVLLPLDNRISNKAVLSDTPSSGMCL